MPVARRASIPCRPSRRRFLAGSLPLVGVMATGCAADPAEGPGATGAIRLRRDDPSGYQNFVVNWDAGTEVLCAVVRTPAEYARLFHPAPVIGGRKPFAPADDAFEKEHLLVVARVVGGDGGSRLSIERAAREGDVLEVHFDDRPSTARSSFRVKQVALAWIPVGDARRVTFLGNGKPVATLEPDEGRWVAPSLAEEAPLGEGTPTSP